MSRVWDVVGELQSRSKQPGPLRRASPRRFGALRRSSTLTCSYCSVEVRPLLLRRAVRAALAVTTARLCIDVFVLQLVEVQHYIRLPAEVSIEPL